MALAGGIPPKNFKEASSSESSPAAGILEETSDVVDHSGEGKVNFASTVCTNYVNMILVHTEVVLNVSDFEAKLKSLKEHIGAQADTLQPERGRAIVIARVKDENALTTFSYVRYFQLFYSICRLYDKPRILNRKTKLH